MSLLKINAAMVKAYEDNFTLETAYEAVDFSPDVDQWAQVRFVPISDFPASMGAGGLDETRGIMQVDFNQAKNKGAGWLLQKADELKTVFYAGKRFDYLDQSVVIEESDRSQIFTIDNKWNRIILSVIYSSHSLRPEG